MTLEQMKQTIAKYKTLFKQAGFQAEQYPCKHLVTDKAYQLKHCAWMLEQMEILVQHAETPWLYDTVSKTEKLMRWLGFIQGVLWAQSLFTINQMKEDNRGTIEVW